MKFEFVISLREARETIEALKDSFRFIMKKAEMTSSNSFILEGEDEVNTVIEFLASRGSDFECNEL